jgi:plasmid stability protein
MKNITLKIDDETYRKARIKAVEKGTSVSAMVREILIRETAGDDDREARRIESLEKLYREADERARQKPAREEPLVPLTRDEIYAERLR